MSSLLPVASGYTFTAAHATFNLDSPVALDVRPVVAFHVGFDEDDALRGEPLVPSPDGCLVAARDLRRQEGDGERFALDATFLEWPGCAASDLTARALAAIDAKFPDWRAVAGGADK